MHDEPRMRLWQELKLGHLTSSLALNDRFENVFVELVRMPHQLN